AAPVGHQKLAVVPRKRGHHIERAERIERAKLDPGLPEEAPVFPGGADRAEPVMKDADLHALARARGEQLGKAPAHRIAADDVVLEMDPALGAGDEVVHRGIAVGPVDERRHAVPGNRAATRGAVHGGVHRLNPAGRLVLRHPAPRPISRSWGRSAASTKSMCWSSGTPSSSAPRSTSSRLTPRAKALSFSFFRTLFTSRSARLLDGRTSAHATRNPQSSSTAKSARAIGVSRETPV